MAGVGRSTDTDSWFGAQQGHLPSYEDPSCLRSSSSGSPVHSNVGSWKPQLCCHRGIEAWRWFSYPTKPVGWGGEQCSQAIAQKGPEDFLQYLSIQTHLQGNLWTSSHHRSHVGILSLILLSPCGKERLQVGSAESMMERKGYGWERWGGERRGTNPDSENSLRF